MGRHDAGWAPMPISRMAPLPPLTDDWAERYPAIAVAAAALQVRSFLIDGEAVIADIRGVASFNLLRGRTREAHAFLWAFDVLELDGADLRDVPLRARSPPARCAAA